MKRKIEYMITVSLIAVVIILNSTFQVKAAVPNQSQLINNEEIYNEGNTRIIYQGKGDYIILQQFNNNILERKDIVDLNKKVVKCKIYDKGKATGETLVLYGNNSIEVENNPIIMKAAKKTTTLGTIKYSTSASGKKKNYGLKCTYSSSTGNSTYTIDAYKGYLVDLVALIVSCTSLYASIATSFIRAVCAAAGISIVSGVIKKKLTTTVACKKNNL